MPQTMINVKLPARRNVVDLPAVQSEVAAVETILGQRGRVLLRPSGTEPLIRVMVEGEDAIEVQQLARRLADVVAGEVGA